MHVLREGSTMHSIDRGCSMHVSRESSVVSRDGKHVQSNFDKRDFMRRDLVSKRDVRACFLKHHTTYLGKGDEMKCKRDIPKFSTGNNKMPVFERFSTVVACAKVELVTW
jgi:hypothetical protein